MNYTKLAAICANGALRGYPRSDHTLNFDHTSSAANGKISESKEDRRCAAIKADWI